MHSALYDIHAIHNINYNENLYFVGVSKYKQIHTIINNDLIYALHSVPFTLYISHYAFHTMHFTL